VHISHMKIIKNLHHQLNYFQKHSIAKKHKLFSQMWVGGWVGVHQRVCERERKRERERVLNFKAYITDSNNDRGAFILQQSLKKYVKLHKITRLIIPVSFLDLKYNFANTHFNFFTCYLYCLNSKKQSSIQVV